MLHSVLMDISCILCFRNGFLLAASLLRCLVSKSKVLLKIGHCDVLVLQCVLCYFHWPIIARLRHDCMINLIDCLRLEI